MLSVQAQDKMKKYIDNHNWFRSNYQILQEKYNERYVAVKNSNDIDSDNDYIKLIERLKTNSIFDESVYVDIVSKKNVVIMH